MYFILHWLPEWFTLWAIYIACIIGVGLYSFSKIISWIPGFGQYKLPAEILGVVLFSIGMYFSGVSTRPTTELGVSMPRRRPP